MKVFVTGATGFIGSAVVQELIGAGHQVLGLSRSDKGAAALAAAGADVQRGTLEDLDSLKRGVESADAVIHLAFMHDGLDFVAANKADKRAIETLGDVLAGSGRPFINTTGTMLLTPGHVGTEDAAADPNSAGALRVPSEEAGLALAARGVRASVVRLSPTVHGTGEHGFVPMMIDLARAKGMSAYVGDGQNRWPAVHRLDAARLYRLVLEQGEAGARYHGVQDEGVPVRDIAEVIGRHLSVPVVSLSPEEAAAHFGFLSFVAGVDNPVSSALTQQRLGWTPTQPKLLADMEQCYFG